MSIAGRIGLTLTILPLAEIAVFVLVAIALGFWTAALLVLLTSLLGALLLRLGGRVHLRRFRDSLGSNVEFTADAAGRSVFLVLGGILLLVPGFLTDILGLLILLPATRRRIGDFVNRSIADVVGGGARPPVVDLEPDEWQRHADRPSRVPAPRHLDDRGS